MYRYKPHCSIAATLPRALPHAATLPPSGGRTRGRRWTLPLGFAAAALVLALGAAGAVLLPRQAAAPAAAPARPPLDKAVMRTVAVGSVPLDIAVDAASGRAFVASRDDSGRGVISTIDTMTGKLLRTTTTTSAGLGAVIAIDARRGRAFIANSGMPGQFGAMNFGTISVLDTRSGRFVRTIRLPAQNIALDAATGRLFVTSGGTFRTSHGRLLAGRVTTLDESGRVLSSILPGPFPGAIAVDAAANHVFVTISGPFFKGPGAAVMLDARTGRILRATPAGVFPTSAVADGRTGHVFVVNSALASRNLTLSSLTMLDARSGRALRTISLWGANGAYLSARTRRVFVTTVYGTVVMLDTRSGRILRTIAAGRSSFFSFDNQAAAVDERRSRVYVAAGDRVLVLDATTGHVLRTLRVPGDIVTVDAASGHAFVAAQAVAAYSRPPVILGRPAAPSTPGQVSVLDLTR